MSLSQRILAIVSLLALAILLHTGLCEWYFRCRVTSIEWMRSSFLLYTHRATDPIIVSGLFPDAQSRDVAFVLGIVVPLALLALAAYLSLGFLQRARIL